MEQVVTFHNGNTMPKVGLGTFRVEEGQQLVEAVKHAIVSGYRSIDTARIYDNEKSVGEGIRQGIEAAGISRSDLFITTKLWLDDFGYESALEAYQASLDRLGLDYVDLYLLHWPGTDEQLYFDSWKALEKLYNDGKVRNIGVSNFAIQHFERLLEVASVKPVINQVEFTPYLNQKELRDYMKEKFIVAESWSPLMNGEILTNEVVMNIAEKHGKSPAQIIIRWNIENDVVIIPKSVTPERIEENLNVYDFELTKEDHYELDQLNEDRRVGPDPADYNGNN
ncbi:aldo/keto reductase [Macrococcus hajekii]|uniref:Aldo/keto reductase n=1 Tax=Macrococcus hajekii TaxID=198482 RepID=A0A4R6BLN1_9STAP|nr:aldo/keto reductase [Macrococcus hajekii]TDM02608.1 aldo/keto reductase [Macrococcus hajekii]GGB02400.1 glyoxal reductase [Macrococcus hajekii]